MSDLLYQTLVEALQAAPAEKPFVTVWHDDDDSQSVTFGEFRHMAAIQAHAYRAAGAETGDRVILLLPQGIELMAAFVGAMLLGAIPAILAYPNFKVDPEKYRTGLQGVSRNLSAKLIVLDADFPDRFRSSIEETSESTVLQYAASRTGETDWGANGRPAETTDDAFPAFEGSQLAFIQHSAGTTGLQKGVALTHAAVLRQLDDLGRALAISEQDRVYSWLPLYHDMGLIACFMLPMVYHLPIVMQSPNHWVIQPETMLKLISENRCTLTWVPNFTLQFLAKRVRADELDEYDLSSMRYIINCSEPVQAKSVDAFTAAFAQCGLRVDALQSSYAMAENVFAVTQSGINGSRTPQRLTVDLKRLQDEHLAVEATAADARAVELISSGSLLPGTHIRIVDGVGKGLEEGNLGEIFVKSESLFGGYFNRPDLTAEALRDGWYATGDLGFIWSDELFVTGRKKDLIIVGGKNIYPHDVEEIAMRHELIHDGRAVAFGLFDANTGTEDIVIVAEFESEELVSDDFSTELSIRNQITAELGISVRNIYLKPPRWIVKSTAGKPARAATKSKLLSAHPELADRYQIGELS